MDNILSPKVGIIILNWNGYTDTIECLNSLLEEKYPNKCIIVVDNGSEDQSVENISNWAHLNNVLVNTIENLDNSGFSHNTLDNNGIFILKNNENLGFAAGNNVGVKFALYLGVKYVALLNNDTTVENDYLCSLVSLLENNSDFMAASSLIRYYDEKDIIWYGGAKIFSFMYLRKYFYSDKNIDQLPNRDYIETSLVTGCSLLFNPLRAGFLSEDFFYGEEDYEFTLRIKKRNYKLACVLNSIIYHKVGRSIKPQENKLGKICLYYVNRFVHLKRYFKYSISWKLAIFPQMLYLSLLLTKNGIKNKSIRLLAKEIYRRSKLMNRIDRSDFLEIINLNFE